MTKPFWVDGRKKIPEKCPLNDDGQPLTAIYSPCSACMQADFLQAGSALGLKGFIRNGKAYLKADLSLVC